MPRKHVTWSPVVATVSRPTSTAKKARRRRSVIVFEFAGQSRRVEGNLVAHSRRNTHSTLLTIRNAHHRDMQLLIDLPERNIRKLYDGDSAYIVDDDASHTMRMHVERLGTVVWRDDNETVRRADARGFSVVWLKGTTTLPVRTVRQPREYDRSRRHCTRKRTLMRDSRHRTHRTTHRARA